MNKEDILKILEGAKNKNGDVPMRLVRQAFEKLPIECEDAVSRNEFLKRIEPYNTSDKMDKVLYNFAFNKIISCSSVTPKCKTGKWIVHYECPKCGEITKDFTEYCPFCNADMRGKQDDN